MWRLIRRHATTHTHTQFPPSAGEAKKAGQGGWNIWALIEAAEKRLETWDDEHGSRYYAASTAFDVALIQVGAFDRDGRRRLDAPDRARFDARGLCQEIDAWLDDGEPVPSFLHAAVHRIEDDE